MDFDEDERQALFDEGVDPDDPATHADQQWVSDLLRCYGMDLLFGES
ncbi:hypothetical protein [Nocardia huaxiensis]|uniref:Uncharacterized protein n=1 Tax=Nocardia huaxiensis TaxID=2755382 RepID=A0A7D6ZLA8_9NOCA|nr:hypothetical protein [Nocardia huaxiensis]QLY33979.1 hypothetical protein H0264_18640 [Nocardia huaxiensis]UFS99119.1 hypothetical protein LPY97_15070 [Nocardia huaxiensis]